MVKQVGYSYTDDGDLAIENGDFKKGEITRQLQGNLLLAEKGSYKQFPTIGVAAFTYILDDKEPDELQQDIQEEFEGDGIEITKLTVRSPNDIEIESHYR